MFNLLLPLDTKGLKTKTNWCISSKYFCISYNNRDTFYHPAIILTHLLKSTRLLFVKIMTKHRALKIIQFRLLGKCTVLRIFCFRLVKLIIFTDITMKHRITEKYKISLQNVIKIYFLHMEKHN